MLVENLVQHGIYDNVTKYDAIAGSPAAAAVQKPFTRNFRNSMKQGYFVQVVPSLSPALILLGPLNYFLPRDSMPIMFQRENSLSLILFRFINLDLERTSLL